MGDEKMTGSNDTESSFWLNRNVFVTGGTGFIGSWLVKCLVDRGARVTTLVLDSSSQSELSRSGYINRISIVNGRLEDLYAECLQTKSKWYDSAIGQIFMDLRWAKRMTQGDI